LENTQLQYFSLDLIKAIAYRMTDLDHVKRVVLQPDNCQGLINGMIPWDDLSIAKGYSSLLLLFSALDRLFPDENWDSRVHTCVLKVIGVLEEQTNQTLSLFGGLAGTCFALQQASRGGTRYQRMIATLNEVLLKQVKAKYFIPFEHHLNTSQFVPDYYYDVIQGVAGVGIYFLQNLSLFSEVLREMLQLLVRFIQPKKINGRLIPGWYTPKEYFYLEQDKIRFPMGNFNLGLAHGMTGVLAFLSICTLNGIEVSDQSESMTIMADWLQSKRRKKGNCYFWEHLIPFEAECAPQEKESHFQREAWCYGTPGVTRSLFLAGKALKNRALESFALESFSSLFLRESKSWGLSSPNICHGIGGLLLLTHLMANDTQDPILQSHSLSLEKELFSLYKSDYPFGFKDHSLTSSGSPIEVNNIGTLEGTSGILLVLLSLYSRRYDWHLPFLMNVPQVHS
jgi:hypothetical protein